MAKSQNTKPSIIIGCYVALVLLFLNAFGPFYNIQSTVLFVMVPILAIIALRYDIYSFGENNKEFLLFFVLIIFMLTTVFYDINYDMFIKAYNGMIGCLLAAYIPIGLNKNNNFENYFHVGFVISIIALLYIEYSIGNFSLTGFATVRGSRGRFFFNANYYSYISYFANFSLFYLYLKYRNLITSLLLFVLPLLLVILSFITQSRSGLLFIILINGVFWFYIVQLDSKNKLLKIIKFFFLIIASIFVALQLISTFQNSQIKNRISESTEDSRTLLAKEGIDVFASNPFFGVGLGQFPRYSASGQFTHNSFIEVLAEHGLVGGLFLFSLFGIPLIKSFNNLKKNRFDSVNKLNFLFFVTFLIYNNAYVFYKVSFAMIYFFLVVSFQNRLKNNENSI